MLHFELLEKFRTADGREFLLEHDHCGSFMCELARRIDPTAEPVGIEIVCETRAQRAARRAALANF